VAQNARIEELRKKLEREPGSPLFAQYAEELRRAGDLGEAIRICREGLAKHPGYASARITLARALATSGEAAAARSEFEAVLRVAPDNVIAQRGIEELASDGARAWGDRGGQGPTPVAAPVASEATVGAEAPSPAVAVDAAPSSVTDVPAPSAPTVAPAAEASVAAEQVERPPAAEDEEYELEPLRPAAPSGPPQLTFRPLFEEDAGQAAGAWPRPEAASVETGPPPQAEATGPPREERPVGVELASPTLAELYFEQGSFERAAQIYEELLAREPDSARLAARLQQVRGRIGTRADQGPRGTREELLRRAIARLQELRSSVRASAQNRAHGADA